MAVDVLNDSLHASSDFSAQIALHHAITTSPVQDIKNSCVNSVTKKNDNQEIQQLGL
jgi:hypothetical protein